MLQTFGEKGKEVVTVSPSFEMYWVNCNILGLKHVPVSYEDDLTIDINKILDVINEDTRIVVLLNPNNPVGNVYTEEEVILKAVEEARLSILKKLDIQDAQTFLTTAIASSMSIPLCPN